MYMKKGSVGVEMGLLILMLRVLNARIVLITLFVKTVMNLIFLRDFGGLGLIVVIFRSVGICLGIVLEGFRRIYAWRGTWGLCVRLVMCMG